MERPVIHSMKRRCFCHDYHERGIYMITLEVEGRRPILGSLAGERVALSPLGEAVADCWRQIPRFHPEVQLLECAVMPDHFHGLLFVRRRMARHLGEVVRGLKIGCTKACRAMYGAPPNPPAHPAGTPSNQLGGRFFGINAQLVEGPSGCNARSGEGPYMARSLFTPGYHDRILTHKGQLEILFRYIRDNPRRLAVRRAHPDYFTRINALPLAGATYAAYGNPFLLNRPDRLQIQCSRRISPEALAAEQARLLDAAARGAVLVSPCISPGEKLIARAAMEEGLPLIALKADGFAPMYKPPGRSFDACAKGKLLLLAPVEDRAMYGAPPNRPTHHNGAKQPAAARFGAAPYMTRLTRSQCLALNQLAADICGPGAAALNYAGLVPFEQPHSAAPIPFFTGS